MRWLASPDKEWRDRPGKEWRDNKRKRNSVASSLAMALLALALVLAASVEAVQTAAQLWPALGVNGEERAVAEEGSPVYRKTTDHEDLGDHEDRTVLKRG